MSPISLSCIPILPLSPSSFPPPSLPAIICALMFLVSFPFILGNGLYLFQLWDQYCATIPLLIIGLFEFIAIGWVYGVKK